MEYFVQLKRMLRTRPKLVASVVGGVFIGSVGFATGAGFDYLGFGSGFSSPGATASPAASSLLIADQTSKSAARLQSDAADCANNGLGKDIKDAQKIHETLAWAQPNTEKLFDVNQACFSSLSQIWDLSFSIPSLSSIISSAINAVKQYAQQRVCTAVNEVSSMVAQPINQAMSQVNGLYGGLSGGGLISGAMSEIDPQLGNQFQMPRGDTTFQLGDGFNAMQSSFNNGSGSSGSGTFSDLLNQSSSSINSIFNSQTAATSQLYNQTQQLNQAQQQYNRCLGSGGSCTQQQQQVLNIQSQITATQNTLQDLGRQLNEASQNTPYTSFGQGSSSQGSSSGSAPALSTTPNNNSSYSDRLKNLFN
jgi:hypothetical protein